MKAYFLKRAESDVTFISNDGFIIQQMIQKSKATKERENKIVTVIAYNETNEVVAKFEMGVSLKVK